MAPSGYLASTAVTTAVLLGIGAAVFRLREWRHVEPPRRYESDGPPLPGERAAQRFQSDPRVWMLLFVLLTLAVGGGALLAVQGTIGATGVALAIVGVLALFVVLGVYAAAKGRGHGPARTAAETFTVAGTLVLVAILAKLLIEGGS